MNSEISAGISVFEIQEKDLKVKGLPSYPVMYLLNNETLAEINAISDQSEYRVLMWQYVK